MDQIQDKYKIQKSQYMTDLEMERELVTKDVQKDVEERVGETFMKKERMKKAKIELD